MNIKLYALCFFVSFFASCKKENALDCFTSTGKTVSEIRNTGTFSRIILNNKINLTVFKGSEFKVELIAGQHILKNISTKVTNDVLSIDDNNTCNFVRGYKHEINVKITVPHVNLITNAGVGTLKLSENFQQDTIVVRNESSGDSYVFGKFNQIRTSTHGNGDMFVNGETNDLYVYSNGTNFVRTEHLKVRNYVFVESLTIGDCYLNVEGTKLFEYNIRSSGNIYYTGQSQSQINIGVGTKGGKAIKLN